VLDSGPVLAVELAVAIPLLAAAYEDLGWTATTVKPPFAVSPFTGLRHRPPLPEPCDLYL
jgi:hypothetical protein